MTSASKPRKGVQLDPGDPTDRQIIARQVKAARQAGREGRDRAGSTRGRADLEVAYDEGAEHAASESASEGEPTGEGGRESTAGKSTARRAWDGYRRMGPGWQSVKPTSPARLPTRAGDAGGFLAGLALYTVVIIYIRYGPAGWKWWLSAKFLNKPMSKGATGAMGSKPKSKSGGSLAV